MKANKILISLLLLNVIIFLPSLLHAQPNFSDDVVDAPVDGGLSILIAGGVGYGIKIIKDARKKTQLSK
jgi:hypothetical protein